MDITFKTNNVVSRKITATTIADGIPVTMNIDVQGEKTLSRVEAIFKDDKTQYGVLYFEGNMMRINGAFSAESLQLISNNAQKIIDEVNNIL